ncbi:hypothetical protein ACJVDH_05680 [Pedobacter sp. AW1-32]|uniref:DUF7336 domain-containing protein n=1 Tax=Pedobacter sp. AW1-32 TaxID=3383026 RepID=UPI003FED80BF
MIIEIVYLLWHTHVNENLEDGEDVKLIGAYSTREKAEEALSRSIRLEGFKDFPEGFEISAYKLDKDEWTSGFVTEN